jgi:Spy/CpxP family protein refolding chaperone
MTTKGLKYLSAVAALTVVGAGPLRAEATSTGPRGQRGVGRSERLAKILDLTEEQQASWKSLHEQHRTDMQPLREEAHDLHQKLRAAMDAPNPDAAAVGAAMLAMKQHREKVQAAETAFQGQLSSLLTPEQKTKYDALRSAHGFGRGHWGGPRMRAPSGTSPESRPEGPTEGPTEG